MTAATGAIPVLRNGTVFTADMIAFAFKIVRMTGRTVRGVLRPGIRNCIIYGTAVTCATARIIAMVTGVVPCWIMAEAGRRPAIGGMTGIALKSRV